MTDDAHEYMVKVDWKHGRVGDLIIEGKQKVEISAPPEFDGPEGIISPEDLFVASATMCFMNGFVEFTKKMRIEFKSFECDAVGTLEKVERSFEVTKIDTKTKVVIDSEDNRKRIGRALELAAKYCFIGNSMKCPITHDTDVVVV